MYYISSVINFRRFVNRRWSQSYRGTHFTNKCVVLNLCPVKRKENFEKNKTVKDTHKKRESKKCIHF